MPENYYKKDPGIRLSLNHITRISIAHPDIFFLLFSLSLSLVLYWNLLWQQQFIISDTNGDLMDQFIAWRSFAASEIHSGNFPFWNPYVFGGAPYFGSMQSALFYPPNLLFLLLPIVSAINWSVALHTWLMGFFTYLWLRYGRGLAPLSAGFGGVIAMFSAPFLMHIVAGHLSNISTMIWVPLILLAFDRWSVTGRGRWLAFGSLAVAMQVFAGHPQYLFYTGVTVVLITGFKWLFGHASFTRSVIGICAIYFLGSLLGAVQLLPGLEAAHESVRAAGISYTYAAGFSMPIQSLLTLIAPAIWDVPEKKVPLMLESNLYFGVVTLVLFFVGLKIRRSNDNIVYLLTMVVLFLLALGANTPLFAILFHYVPGFNLFRGSAKFAFFLILIAVYFSAYGTERLLNQPNSITTFAPGRILAITIAVAGCALWLSQLVPGGKNSVVSQAVSAENNPALFAPAHAGMLLYSAAALLALTALLIWQAQKERRGAVWVLMLLALGEAGFFASTHQSNFSLSQLTESKTVQFLKSHYGNDRVLNLVLPNAGMLTHTPEVWGSDPGILLRWGEFIAATQKARLPYLNFSQIPPAMALTRLHWVIERNAVRWQARDILFPMPRVSIFSHVETIADKEQRLTRLLDPQFDFRHTLLLESKPTLQPVAGAMGEISIMNSDSDSLELLVKLSAPAYLLITDAYSRGWHIRGIEESRDGDYRLVPADHAFIGVPLAAGQHHLLLTYRPVFWWYGVSLSLFGLICLGLLWRWDKKKKS